MKALCIIPGWLETEVKMRLEIVPQKLNSWSGVSQSLSASEPRLTHPNGKQVLEASLGLLSKQGKPFTSEGLLCSFYKMGKPVF